MFGWGSGSPLADFRRVGQHPKAVVVALACQLVLLPAICFGLVVLFDLPPFLGIGMLLLAASPGGTTANLFSHLFRGDVALNISLTAINSVIAIGTLPLITNLAIDFFDKSESVSMPLDEVVKVFVLILVPTGLGMLVRARKASFAAAMDKPVRIASAVILGILVLGILLGERERVGEYIADVGLVAAIFCALSLVIGYYVPRALGVIERQSIASSFEIGVHNGTLAIFVAENILEVNEIAVPAAVYSLLMFVFAALWGMFISRRVGSASEPVSA
jgi:BASS family bile acid:Na+ symporter